MEYFIKGSAHFFNLFTDFLEHCENVIYFIFVIILLFLIIATFKKIKDSLKGVLKSYLGLFKFIPFLLAFVLLLASAILTYKMNNQFQVLSLLVATINFFKETFNIYDDKILNVDNSKIFKWKDFRNILLPNIVLIFFKITYWAELYTFDFKEIKLYFIVMAIIIFIQLTIMILFKLYSIYSVVFQFLKTKNNYKTLSKIKDLLAILFISKNDINYYRITKVYFQREIITKGNKKYIINFNYFYKSISKQLILEDKNKSNLIIYREFKNVIDRIGSDLDE